MTHTHGGRRPGAGRRCLYPEKGHRLDVHVTTEVMERVTDIASTFGCSKQDALCGLVLSASILEVQREMGPLVHDPRRP
jgi:hypothetical protein